MAETKEYPVLPISDSINIGDDEVTLSKPPGGLIVREKLGILTSTGVDGQVVYRTEKGTLFETRATITPGGDYLLMFPTNTAHNPEGRSHYGGSPEKSNDLVAYRSKDRGQTWQGPAVPIDIDYNLHGLVPLIPRATDGKAGKRLYCFGTQPIWGMYSRDDGLQENAPIGYRYSDDDGYTWSEVRVIRPENDPGFRGMSVMRMCETDAGTWIIGAHEGDWTYKPLITRQYMLRSENQGRTWELLPGKRHGGWFAPPYGRMDELRPINLGGGKVYAMARTPEGRLWDFRSDDDGKTWSDPQPTTLIHPDAPPMLFHLSDGKTLAAFHHNRYHDKNYIGLGARPEVMADRSEIWVSLSVDEGRSWSEPRFLFANALAPSFENAFFNYQCSYTDVFLDGTQMNMFVPHRWHQVLHLRFDEEILESLPLRSDILG